jgi:hypothetical protein
MRNPFAALLLVIVAASLPSFSTPATAQMTCYKKTCLEYSDGTKICELRPVDCSAVKIL